MKAPSGARGGAITLAGQLGKVAIQFLSVTVLSRLLLPDDFGLIAMTAVFVALGSLLRDFGMPTAALQARTLERSHASNLFWLNTALALVGAGCLVAAAPAIAELYSEPRLIEIVPFMAINIVLGGLAAQYQVNLARGFRYLSLAVAEIGSQVVGLVVAIMCALGGLGYWALAWQTVAIGMTLLLLQVAASRWIPGPPNARGGTTPIVKSGLDFGAAQFLTFAASSADTVFIGARWGAEELGYYSRAFQLLAMPIQAMMTPLTNVVIPLVNRARHHGASVDTVLVRIQFVVGSATVWVFMVAAAGAQHLVPILLGPGWERSVALFQILSIGGAIQVLSFVSYWGFMLYDQSRQLLFYNLVTKTLAVLAIAVASAFGIEAVAWAYSMSLALSWPINLIWLARSAGQDSWSYFRNGSRVLAAATVGVVVATAVLGLTNFSGSPVLGLLITTTVATAVYGAALIVVPGGLGLLKEGFRSILPGLATKR